MATNTHGYVNTMKMACTNVDALNAAGVASVDLDNGVLVTLTKMAQDSAFNATGFEFEVAAAEATSKDVWLVATPEVGSTIAQQSLSDPREFYNEAHRAMSIKHIVPDVDYVEMDANCFTDGTLPTNTNKYATIGAGGKLTATASAPSTAGVYFDFVANHSIAVGMNIVSTVILRARVHA